MTDKKEDIYVTSSSLLARIKEGDDISWQEFYDTYKKFIWTIAKYYNVREADRDDVITQVINELYRTRERFQYDRSKGRFRDYLRRVVQHHILRSRRKELGMENIDDPAIPPPNVDGFGPVWDAEWKEHVLEQAQLVLKDRMDPVSFQVFNLLTKDGEKPEDVAKALGLKIEQVYAVKHRGLERLRTYRTMLGDDNAEFEKDEENGK